MASGVCALRLGSISSFRCPAAGRWLRRATKSARLLCALPEDARSL